MDIVNIVLAIISLAIGMVGAIYTYKSYLKARTLKTISWTDVHNGTKYIWKELRHLHYNPDVMISPDPKSGIVAYMLTKFFDYDIFVDVGQAMRKSASISMMDAPEHFSIISTNKWKVLLSKQLEHMKEKENVRILIVDDFVLSGDFNSQLTEWLKNQGYKEENIMVCCLAVTKVAISSAKAPDLYWKIVDDENFYFPWGKAE